MCLVGWICPSRLMYNPKYTIFVRFDCIPYLKIYFFDLQIGQVNHSKKYFVISQYKL